MEVMQKVTEVAMKYDTDGIEIQFLNSNEGRTVKVRPGTAMRLTKRPADLDGSRWRTSDRYSSK
jgi:hypothetical protein